HDSERGLICYTFAVDEKADNVSQSEDQPEVAAQEVVWEDAAPGKWQYDKGTGPASMDPSVFRRRIASEEQCTLVADHVVQRRKLLIGGDLIVDDNGCVRNVVITNLIALVGAVQRHKDAHHTYNVRIDSNGFARLHDTFAMMSARYDATTLDLRNCIVDSDDGNRVSNIGCRINLRLSDTHFTKSLYFYDVNFYGRVRFVGCVFANTIGLVKCKFLSDISFDTCIFRRKLTLDRSCFSRYLHFKDSVLLGEVQLEDARIASSFKLDSTDAKYGMNLAGCCFLPDADIGDLRCLDVRYSRIIQPDINRKLFAEYGYTTSVMLWLLTWIRLLLRDLRVYFFKVGWTTLRSIGELSLLTRISVLALIAVPPLASAWPAIRSGIVGYNESVTDISERFESAATKLNEANERVASPEEIRELVTEVELSIGSWSKRFGSMTIDKQDLPASMAIAFFAAVSVTIAQLIYQSRAPSMVKKYDESEHIRQIGDRISANSEGRTDALSKACRSLSTIATILPTRHANIVERHKVVVWIPSQSDLKLFEDVQLRGMNSSSPHRYPDGYVTAAERARIAIEEGAKAEYWVASREHIISAWVCLIFYTLGLASILVILFIQGRNVGRAAGFW
ncbi:MAG: hypothetical protein KDC69_11145, partial [Flavobacteriaceae bacterium]|nr:hypothetical protein [Flavobacteriaceae bacterium]